MAASGAMIAPIIKKSKPCFLLMIVGVTGCPLRNFLIASVPFGERGIISA
jgi:hypothetical protein